MLVLNMLISRKKTQNREIALSPDLLPWLKSTTSGRMQGMPLTGCMWETPEPCWCCSLATSAFFTFHSITESLGLEKTLKVTEPNYQPAKRNKSSSHSPVRNGSVSDSLHQGLAQQHHEFLSAPKLPGGRRPQTVQLDALSRSAAVTLWNDFHLFL